MSGGPSLEDPIQYVPGVGPRLADTLEKLELRTAADLLYHFPRRYEDRRRFRPLGHIRPGEVVVTSGVVVGVDEEKRRNLKLVKVSVRDATGDAVLVFFNQYWLSGAFARLRGKSISIFGTAKVLFGELRFETPEWEELVEDDLSLNVHRITPVHAATEGVTPRMLRKMVWRCVERYADALPETLPAPLRRARSLPPISAAIRQIHFPDSDLALEEARRRLVFEELFLLQAALAVRRRQASEAYTAPAFSTRPEDLAALERSLPFELTDAQRRAIADIRGDLVQTRPMNRLLQGDVGSGKTVVAAAAVVTAARSGYQAAIMAPTEILAEQHYENLRRLLEPLDLRVRRLAGSVRAKGKRLIKEELKSGFCHVVVGTHALIQDDVEFARLGLAVVDEQHRFGVLQRLSLLDKGVGGAMPHMLVMTATPIPRTLALTVYGDLDVSILNELPPGRLPVKTHWRRKDERERVYQGVRRLVQEGRQAYYVCPLVEASAKLEAQAATEVFERLSRDAFPDLRVGLLHGQLPSHEKDEVMDRFRLGEIDVLVATVVIEVGVDVPNATCMVVEDAERFGLAQLHQLRGRVGRGEHRSFCVLLADPKTDDGRNRIEVMVRTSDGFEIADEDLRLRGPGEFTGTRQSGVLKLRIADLSGDRELLDEARAAAFALVEDDPQLDRAENACLRDAIRRRFQDLLLAAAA